ncbi:hypothetical protein [Streptomyces sp. AM 3-1-1]|uniref:hypothetical protein n=1 Tax=Streptomyces sp. AM 3-1-1 TaxID=3028711 RepID=UPI0023B936F1|nr:hypothetical protein [Streptomyces sp. AM 3-1-1]WEH25979.1 hypothetical protein P0D76_00840 [Streptomyces sp. AM 3-1-1]
MAGEKNPEDLPRVVTPDDELHTGADQESTPEDLVQATGRDVTPENLEWARKKLAEEGREAIERLLP